MRPVAVGFLLAAAACGSSTPSFDGCTTTTPQGTFSFRAQQELAACGFPVTFDLSVTVTSTDVTGTENGVAFTARRYSSCQLVWADATTLHVIQIDARSETLVRISDGCSAVYALQ